MKTKISKLLAPLVVICAVALTSSCGGGGGGGGSSPPPGTISYSASSISFKVAAPFAVAPATQTITGTVTGVTSGTLYLKIVANNAITGNTNGLFTVTNLTITGFSGQADVIPALPASFGAGSFNGSITITACLNDSSCQTGQLAGSPKTIAVNYDIATGVDGNTVTPHVVPANAEGNVILRGSGFTGVTAVNFGAVAATSMTLVNDSEIDAVYPALPSGTYPLTLSGDPSYSASLTVVPSPAFTATAIPFPVSVTPNFQEIARLEYDAPRMALFILIPGGVSTDTTLLRYAFDGSAWGSPTQSSIAGLVQVHLSPDGSRLLALVAPPDGGHTTMLELDPVTLAQTNSTTVADYYKQFDPPCGFALANDGNAIVGTTEDFGFAFGTFSRVFTPFASGGGCDPIASGNGAIVTHPNFSFLASSESIVAGGAETASGSTTDIAGDKFATAGVVQTRTGQTLGTVNGVFGQVMNSTGTRLYGVSPDGVSFQPTLVTIDLTATPTGTTPLYPPIGTPIPLPGCPVGGCPEVFYALGITPDDATVFIVTPTYFVVQPITP
jgi:hypothetical protein